MPKSRTFADKFLYEVDIDLLEVGNRNLTKDEELTHFSFWAALKSPLIISTHLARIRNASLEIILNNKIIDIPQDDHGTAVDYALDISLGASVQIWAAPLGSGRSRFVILASKEGILARNISIPLQNVPRYIPGKYSVRDIWGQKYLGLTEANITLSDM